MAKAQLKLPDGTAVTVEGNPDEVAQLALLLTSATKEGANQRVTSGTGRRASNGSASGPRPHTGLRGYIQDLIAEGFFATKQGLGDVQKKLEEGAHIYPVTTISPTLFRMVRAKQLRRIKEGGTWKYVNP